MTTEEMKDLIRSLELLKLFFNDDEKVAFWMTTENPHLGEAKPFNLFLRGRGHKVKAFIEASIEENFK